MIQVGIMHKNRSWEVGDTVNIGFMKGLTILEKVPTPGDYAADAYILISKTGVKYRFVPHQGLTRED